MTLPLSISLAHAPLKTRPELAGIADSAGFNTIWVEDSDAFVSLAYMAREVQRARLGTGIARAFSRSPLVTATAAANLWEITDGRFVLGLGSGTKRQNLYQLGLDIQHPATQVAMLRNMLRDMWEAGPEESLHYDNDFYHLQLDALTLRKTRTAAGSPPVFLAAVNEFMLKTAGRSFDGLAGHPCFSRAFLADVVGPTIEAGLAERKRPRDDFLLSSWIITSIDDDRRTARRRAAYQIGYYFSTKSYHSLLDWHGFGNIQERIRHALFEAQDWEMVADAIPDEMIDVFAVAGTPNDCIDAVGRYEGILDEAVLYSHAAGPARADAEANLRRILKAFG